MHPTLSAQTLDPWLLTRQRCGLVIVGDINVTGQVVDDEGKGKDVTFMVEGPNGEIYFTKASALRKVHEALHSSGWVMTVPIVKKAYEAAEPAE
ncbi:dna helicase [Trichoderma arundinaceum]|uniref:Dna helicase n=1 Tax=Trichoderma arundinaceum TaxID=490622 RepID=A0A395NK74_TRIAR|nr:dna helicase [Trichoderma arundinaceum]